MIPICALSEDLLPKICKHLIYKKYQVSLRLRLNHYPIMQQLHLIVLRM